MADPAETPKRLRSQFQPGQSGNPKGKPRGSRNHVLMALDKIGADAASDVLAAAVKAAKGGDMRAAELILSRVWPARKGRPIPPVAIPPVTTAANLPAALAAITAAVASGALTTDEGAALMVILDAQRRAIETAELERRVAALEGQAPHEPE